MANRVRQTSTEDAQAGVVDLGAARERQRFSRCRGRVDAVLEHHRRALARLFESGLVFTRHGSRVGQELLRAQQHLLRVSDLIGREGRDDGGRTATGLDALFEEVESLLEKTSAIARRNKELFQTR